MRVHKQATHGALRRASCLALTWRLRISVPKLLVLAYLPRTHLEAKKESGQPVEEKIVGLPG